MQGLAYPKLVGVVCVLGSVLACGQSDPPGSDRPAAGSGGSGASGGSGGSGGATGGTGGATGGTGGATGGGAGAAAGGTGGSGGKGGSGAAGKGGSGFAGSGGSPALATGKVDLLFMIDNSLSMGGKQKLLSDSLPYLLGSLTSELGVTDLHLGMITSSLGDHGSGDICFTTESTDPMAHYDDRAELVARVRTGVPSFQDQGFLAWDPSQQNATALVAGAQAHLAAAGEYGCGYEGQLESIYRFLVDPEPVQAMSNDGAVSVRGPVNQVLLAQRAAFLRPDSTLVVVLLTDENDCSITDESGSQGWVAAYKGGPTANSFRLPGGTAICDTAPNDPGCVPSSTPLSIAEDAVNLRCYRQKQRFGVDFLYPTSRYVEAFAASDIDPRGTGTRIPNPLFFGSGGTQTRTPGQVFVLGIVGVPWQDLSTEASWSGAGLEYLTAGALAGEGRWSMIVGDPARNVEPTDPMMVESIDPRPVGTPHPLLGQAAAVASAEATDATANPINGHEQRVIETERSDLQFACIFPFAEPLPCNPDNYNLCDCESYEYAKNSPLCTFPVADADGTQLYGKAYPSRRELDVLSRLGDQAVVASVCAKKTTATGSPATDPDYGYNPAMTALIEALRRAAGP
jgi:hypothetical protein